MKQKKLADQDEYMLQVSSPSPDPKDHQNTSTSLDPMPDPQL